MRSGKEDSGIADGRRDGGGGGGEQHGYCQRLMTEADDLWRITAWQHVLRLVK